MTSLVRYQTPEQDMTQLKTMAAIAVKSGKYGTDYNEATILNIFFTAKSLGIDPLVALNGGFYIVKGKINMGAHFMTALARRKGHSIKVIEMTAQKCVIIGQRKDNGDSLKYEYTIEEAKQAGLTGKDNWRQHTKQMLYSACVRNLFRILFSDLAIAYDADEMNVESLEVEDQTSIEISPPIYSESIALDQTSDPKVFDVYEPETPYQILKSHLIGESICIDFLDQYLKECAVKKERTVEEIIPGILHKDILPKFKHAYSNYVLKQTQPLESIAV
jgi:hypothetical protein